MPTSSLSKAEYLVSAVASFLFQNLSGSRAGPWESTAPRAALEASMVKYSVADGSGCISWEVNESALLLRERGTKDRGKPPGYITKEVIAIDVEILEL